MISEIRPSAAAWLLVRLRLVRWWNLVLGWRAKKSSRPGVRKGTPAKSSGGWAFTAVLGFIMIYGFGSIGQVAIANMRRAFGEPGAPAEFSSEAVLRCATLEVGLLLLASVLATLGSRELAHPEWDLEWLITLPLRLPTLLAIRIVERTLVNPTGLLALWPFLGLIAWEAGYRWAAPVLGLAVTLALLLLGAVARTFVDTGLRLTLGPPELRNLQALISISSVLVLYLAMSPSFHGNTALFEGSTWLPRWVAWTPPGLAVSALTGATAAATFGALSMLALQVSALFALGVAVVARQLRFGVAATGARETGGRARSPATRDTALARVGFLSPVQRRELLLLSRDRNFLVQTLVLPVLIIGAQIFFNARADFFTAGGSRPAHLAAVAFAIAAYALMFSAFQTLNAEGHALWLLYSFPQSISSVLRQKAVLWAVLSLIYPVAIFAIGLALGRPLTAELIGLFAVVVAGVPVYALIATSLGVFGCDPLAQEVQRRIRSSYLYLYLLLGSLYTYAIYAPNLWQRIAFIVLAVLLALALWQKARDHLPFLLDPTASPPPRVSISDGLMAAVLFFVLQGTVYFVGSRPGKPPSALLLFAFVTAGAVTFVVTRLIYWRAKTSGVPRFFGEHGLGALGWGLASGAIATLGSVAYVTYASRLAWFHDALDTSTLSGAKVVWWLVVLAVVAAPVFEEFIFRGLVFGGLRRSLGLWPSALASAAIFAIIHPAVAALPVFGLGICAALAYERTGLLMAPIAAHALYNGSLIAFQWASGR